MTKNDFLCKDQLDLSFCWLHFLSYATPYCCYYEILITRYPVIFKFRDGTGWVIEKKIWSGRVPGSRQTLILPQTFIKVSQNNNKVVEIYKYRTNTIHKSSYSSSTTYFHNLELPSTSCRFHLPLKPMTSPPSCPTWSPQRRHPLSLPLLPHHPLHPPGHLPSLCRLPRLWCNYTHP